VFGDYWFAVQLSGRVTRKREKNPDKWGSASAKPAARQALWDLKDSWDPGSASR
jgi:hypothetical protein